MLYTPTKISNIYETAFQLILTQRIQTTVKKKRLRTSDIINKTNVATSGKKKEKKKESHPPRPSEQHLESLLTASDLAFTLSFLSPPKKASEYKESKAGRASQNAARDPGHLATRDNASCLSTRYWLHHVKAGQVFALFVPLSGFRLP